MLQNNKMVLMRLHLRYNAHIYNITLQTYLFRFIIIEDKYINMPFIEIERLERISNERRKQKRFCT